MIILTKEDAILILRMLHRAQNFIPSKDLSKAQDAVAKALKVPFCFGYDDCSTTCWMSCPVQKECSDAAGTLDD